VQVFRTHEDLVTKRLCPSDVLRLCTPLRLPDEYERTAGDIATLIAGVPLFQMLGARIRSFFFGG